jgi:3,4-dihydroxy 2-butanone 4-phosphate synthase/GTP cyclohydrolase II
MLKNVVESSIPTPYGEFKIIAYAEDEHDLTPHLALVKESSDGKKGVLTRIHSECLTGDIFGSQRCDCGPQLIKSLELIGKAGGILLYLRQEGRGIGIINKLKAYQLQDKGIDTAAANTHLGFKVDERTYEEALVILKDLGIKEIRLLTNNPEKINIFKGSAVKLIERIPLEIAPLRSNKKYLETKKNIMGHLLDLK